MLLIVDDQLPPSATWAMTELERVLHSRGERPVRADSLRAGRAILIGPASGMLAPVLASHAIVCPEAAESLVIQRVNGDQLAIAGRDARGLVYGLLEVARAFEGAERMGDLFDAVVPAVESPYLTWRSMQVFLFNRRLEEEWFYRRSFWDLYLTELARHRYNNISLTYAHQTTYLAPPYPFLVRLLEFPQIQTPGFTESDRARHLDMLRRISEMTRERGLHFTFSVWSQHGANYGHSEVEGLTEDVLLDYNAQGLRAVLEACPAIDGVQFRMNVESGVPEDQQEAFYEKQFRAVAECARPIRLDLRAKGLADDTIRLARAHVPDTVVSTKHWCEHMGMPYPMPIIQQADLQNYRRYGMWDLLAKPQAGPLVYRLWSAGSQRVLLWGDPVWVRRFVRSCRFGAEGFEVMAPLTNKGFQDTRDAWRVIENAEYQPYTEEYQRYWAFYTLFGRLAYNPDTEDGIWERELQLRFGEAGGAVGRVYACGSGILPLLTVVLQWSASIWRFWPEMYAGRSLVEDIQIEPSDPTQFYGIAEYAADAAKGRLSGKWTPLQVAQYLKGLSAETHAAIDAVEQSGFRSAEWRGTALDFGMLADLAEYHACRLRAATGLAMQRETGEMGYLPGAVEAMREARDCWASLVKRANGVYASRLVFGRPGSGHIGHWTDQAEVAARDLLFLERQVLESPGRERWSPGSDSVPERMDVAYEGEEKGMPGRDLVLRICVQRESKAAYAHYRVANQALSFIRIEMQSEDSRYVASIPGATIDGKWDLMVFFEVHLASGHVFRWPDWRVETPYRVIPIDSTQTICRTG